MIKLTLSFLFPSFFSLFLCVCDVFFSKEINYVPLMFSFFLLHSLGTAAVDIGSADKQIKTNVQKH